MTTMRGPLHPGATWRGTQRSGRSTYQLTIQIDRVDFERATLVGSMTIYGLTPALDRLCTHFEGEIVGEGAFDFETKKWGANWNDDWNHWSRFRPSLHHSTLSTPSHSAHDITVDERTNKKALYMRWKEQFVIPQSTQILDSPHNDAMNGPDNIHGASFAGFYYICLDFEPDAVDEDGDGGGRGREGGGMERRRSSAPAAVERGEGRLLPTLPPVVVEEVISNIPNSTPATLPVPPSATPQPLLRHRRYSTGSPHRSRQTYAEIVKSSPSSLTPPSPSLSTPFSPISDADEGTTLQARMPLPGNCGEEEFPLPIFVRELRGQRRLRRMLTTPSTFAPRGDVPEIVVLPPPPATDDEEDFRAAASRVGGSSDESGRSVLSNFESEAEESDNTDESGVEEEIESKSYSNLDEDPSTLDAEDTGSDYRSRGRSRMDGGRYRRLGENKVSPGRGEEIVEEVNHWGFDAWSEATMTGFYFHAHSEPYQQITLKYIPQSRGGSESYNFR